MSSRPRTGTNHLKERRPLSVGRRGIDRRSFLRDALVKGAALGATIGMGTLLRSGAVASAAEATGNRRKKEAPSRNLAAARCPVTGEAVDRDVSIDYLGGKLFFSDAECIQKFRTNRADYEAKANAQLVATGQFKQTRCPLTGEEFLPVVRMKVGGVDVRFASAECLRKLKRISADERIELIFGKGFDKGFASSRPAAAAAAGAGKWSCVVCGYVHTGSTPPAKCPKCGAGSNSFVPAAS